MKRYLFAAGAFALVAATVVVAQDVKPQPVPAAKAQVQPKAIQVQPAQPGAFQPTTRVTAAKMATLEEEFETIEAHRDVRKAYVKAAEVAFASAEMNFELISKAGANVSQIELAKARLEVAAARAQVDTRHAETKEVEVKLKYAKKRLDDAKAGGVRPLPVRPVQVDPPPPRAFGFSATAADPPADPKAVEALKKKVAEAEAAVKDRQEAAKKAEAEAKAAADEHAKILDIAMRGRVRPGTIEAAEAKAKDAKAAAEKAKLALKEAETVLETAKTKLKEIEK